MFLNASFLLSPKGFSRSKIFFPFYFHIYALLPMGPLGTEIQRESKEFYVSDQFYEKTVIAKIAFSPHRLIMVQWFLSMAFGKLLYRRVKLKQVVACFKGKFPFYLKNLLPMIANG